jgi:hypothetical protein
MTTNAKHTWKSVSRSAPCEVCGKDHNCGRAADVELLICRRCGDTPPGWKFIGTAKDGGNMYGPADASSNNLLPKPKPRRPAPPPPPRKDWTAIHAKCRAEVIPGELYDFADAELGLDGWAVDALEAGVHEDRYVFPERDATGTIIGLVKRNLPDSDEPRNKALPTAQRGLTYLHPLPKKDPVLVVEGASDTAAGMEAGYTTVGRFSNKGGGELLAQLLKGRHVIVMGENDAKPDGSWPGREGVEKIVPFLTPVCASVRVLYPPPHTKDVRSWLTEGGAK